MGGHARKRLGGGAVIVYEVKIDMEKREVLVIDEIQGCIASRKFHDALGRSIQTALTEAAASIYEDIMQAARAVEN